MIRGVQPVCYWLAEECERSKCSTRWDTEKQIWWSSDSVFIVPMRKKQCWHALSIKTSVSNYLLSEWFHIKSTAVTVFCITPARDPWKGFFKKRVTLHYTLPMGWLQYFLYFLGDCAPVFAFPCMRIMSWLLSLLTVVFDSIFMCLFVHFCSLNRMCQV